MALLKLGQNVIGNSLADSGTVLNSKTVDLVKNDLACGYIIGQKEAEYTLSFVGDNRAYSVTAANTDDKLVQRLVINKILVLLDPLGSFLLCNKQLFK